MIENKQIVKIFSNNKELKVIFKELIRHIKIKIKISLNNINSQIETYMISKKINLKISISILYNSNCLLKIL
jgi:hypothetical protein